MGIQKKYNQQFETEIKQFLFLCGKKDRLIMLSQGKNKELSEYARLACLALVFGYKTVFLKISAITEKQTDDFLKKLDELNGKFFKLNEWMNEFIENIEFDKAKDLVIELWQERKKQLDCKDFSVKLLLETS